MIDLRLGHSPDPDDAFMWWPLFGLHGEGPRIETGRFRFQALEEDIERLNERAERGNLEITALSCAQYARVRDRYAITSCGASLGEGYGPRLVAARALTAGDLCGSGAVIAVPGERTSAFAALSLMLGPGRFAWRTVPFQEIIEAVAGGRFDGGLVIHEGQLTHEAAGLHLVADLGRWWSQRHGLPLPLGLNAVRRDLEDVHGPGTLREIAGTLRRSVEYALAHRAEGLDYAMRFARGTSSAVADRFIGLYVNRWTLDFGPSGRRAIERFLGAVHEAGLGPDPGAFDFVGA